MPSTIANAARYCRKTTGAWEVKETGWRTTVENMSDPAGETHTLEPRPRPATWTVAVAVKPAGRRRSISVFLFCLALMCIGGSREVFVLFEHSVGACDHFPVQQIVPKPILGFLGLIFVVPQICIKCIVIEVWGLFA